MDNSGNAMYSKQKTLMIGSHTIYELRQVGTTFELIPLYPPDMCGTSTGIKKRGPPKEDGKIKHKFYRASKKHPELWLVSEPIPIPLKPREHWSHSEKEFEKLNAQHF